MLLGRACLRMLFRRLDQLTESSSIPCLDVQGAVLLEDGALGLGVLGQHHLVDTLLVQVDEHDSEQHQHHADQTDHQTKEQLVVISDAGQATGVASHLCHGELGRLVVEAPGRVGGEADIEPRPVLRDPLENAGA